MIDFVLHFDKHLLEFVATYGTWVYGILFGIIFAETGLVVTPFLPGDSLLFATGALAATGVLNPWLAFALLAVAAFTGNAVNYSIGRRVGPAIFTGTADAGVLGRLMNREYLDRAHAFFEQYGWPGDGPESFEYQRKSRSAGRLMPVRFQAGERSVVFPPSTSAALVPPPGRPFPVTKPVTPGSGE